MRKIATILMLIAAILVGGMTMDAKLPRRNQRLKQHKRLPYNGMEIFHQHLFLRIPFSLAISFPTIIASLKNMDIL